MRPPAELWFRLRQEASNLRLLLLPPAAIPVPRPLPLPSPEAVRPLLDPAYTANLFALADRIAAGELPAFSEWLQPGPAIAWRKDYRHGQETGTAYFRQIPYLNFTAAGDHKWIWEINRHQHLVTLAQAWALSGKPDYRTALCAQLESWLGQNPPQRGINWASALEVAFRALSWIWIWHLAGASLPPALARQMLQGLYRHGAHLEANLSVYFSPNTHLLGEALALDALGRFLPNLPESPRWVRLGSHHVAEALRQQVRPDGSHFEQSSYYHVYTLDMLLFHRILAGPGTAEQERALARMAAYLTALLGHDGCLPLIGDDDGGRLFHPFGPRNQFGRGTLAVFHSLSGTPAPSAWADRHCHSEMAAWWLGTAPPPVAVPGAVPRERPSQLFPDAGLAFLTAENTSVIADAGSFGRGSAGHSHADTLQVLVRRGEQELLIDPGTCTYISDPVLRETFRGSAGHATISVTGLPQAQPQGPFRWASPPAVRILAWQPRDGEDWLLASCEYGPIRHRRSIRWERQTPRLWIVDILEWDDATVERELTQHWPLGQEPESVQESTIFCAGARLALEAGGKLSMNSAGRSLHYGHCAHGQAASVVWSSTSPARRVSLIDWQPRHGAVTLQAEWDTNHVTVTALDTGTARVTISLTSEEQTSR
jgi:hypothetical protein